MANNVKFFYKYITASRDSVVPSPIFNVNLGFFC